ncbi:MAG: hypothetical protein QXI20_04265, partial [Candidatus Jordarchaeales archaeon]
MGMRAAAAVLLIVTFTVVFTNIQPYMKYEGFWVYIWDLGMAGLTAWRTWMFINVLLTMLMNAFTSLIVESIIPPIFWLFDPRLFIYLALAEAVVEVFMAAAY